MSEEEKPFSFFETPPGLDDSQLPPPVVNPTNSYTVRVDLIINAPSEEAAHTLVKALLEKAFKDLGLAPQELPKSPEGV